MSTLIFSMASTGIKRSLDEDTAPPTQVTETPNQSEPPQSLTNIPTSPLSRPSPPGSPLSSVASLPDGFPGMDAAHVSSDAPPEAQTDAQNAKRRKLTPAEKEAARLDKERKAEERAAQQAEKEAEKQRRLEEKKQKDEEREEKRRIKEAEKTAKDQERKEKQEKRDALKKAKDDEKKAQEEAKAKKDSSQMRLSSFFSKPKESSPSPAAAPQTGPTSAQESDAQQSPRKPASKLEKAPLFLPFEVRQHSTVAPLSRFERDSESLQHAMNNLDACFELDASAAEAACFKKRSLADALQPPVKRTRYASHVPLKDIIASLRGSESQPIDLTDSSRPSSLDLRRQLSKVRVKLFKYREDVRPPYIGTFTKAPDVCSIRQLSRKPFRMASTKLNYDYDSEAEWEEPEEGEDITSENEDEQDEDDDEDMDGFLDDEEAEGVKRQQVLGDMEPIYTPIHWEASRRTPTSDVVPFGKASVDLKEYRIETLIEQPVYSIDPYSTAYWSTGALKTNSPSSSTGTNVMLPPRIPLNEIPGAMNMTLGEVSAKAAGAAKFGLAPSSATKTKPTKSAAAMPPELMEPFKAAIKDSTLTKVGLIEVLKSKFPTLSKNTVQETLEQIAKREGKTNAEKHWVFKVDV